MRADLTGRDRGARRAAAGVAFPTWLTSSTSTRCSRGSASARPRCEDRPLPPVAGPERQRFIEQAQLDFQDFAIVGDATWDFVDGVLTLRVDLTGTG